MSAALRVVVAEDALLLRAGVVRVLEAAGFAVAGEARDAEELLEQAPRHAPDVVVTDIRMPAHVHRRGPACRHGHRAELPATGVVGLSQHVSQSYALQLLGDGASGVGYLLNDRVMEPSASSPASPRVSRTARSRPPSARASTRSGAS